MCFGFILIVRFRCGSGFGRVWRFLDVVRLGSFGFVFVIFGERLVCCAGKRSGNVCVIVIMNKLL